jgi:hypothetical protein
VMVIVTCKSEDQIQHNESSSTWIPEGYVEVMGPDGQRYLVPGFCAQALQSSLDGLKEKLRLNVEKAAGTVRPDIRKNGITPLCTMVHK